MASLDDRLCDSRSEYGDAEDFNSSQYLITSDKKRKGSPLGDNPIKNRIHSQI